MIEDHADDEHGRAPPDGAEHPLAAVLVLVLLAQQSDHRSVRQSDGRRTKTLI